MNKKLRRSAVQAYTLMELAIATSLLGVVGSVVYTVMNGSMILFSKNIAYNTSNLTVSSASSRMVQDIHESVGRAELVGLDLLPVSTTPAPGVRFPVLLNPAATRVLSDNSGSTSINSVSPTSNVSLRIPQQTVAPQAGDIVIFPDINDLSGNTLMRKISAVTLGSPTVITVKDLGVNLTINTDTPPDPTLIYIARFAAYAMVVTTSTTEIRYYPDASNVNNYTVTNRDLTTFVTGGPFSIYSTGASDPGNSIQIQLISINSETGKRPFSSDRMLLSQIIPPKCLIIQSTNYN